MSERPTLGAVAERAGVSLKTASRAMNGEYGVAAATSARVHAAARALGFRPNHLARALAAGGSSAAVGLVIPSVADPFIAAVVGAVEEVLAPRGFNLMTASHNDDEERQRRIIRGLVERRVDALIVIPAPGDAGYVAAEIHHGLVVVSLDRPMEGALVDTVVVDNVEGAAAAVSALAALGHRRIGGLGTDDRLWTLQQRHDGYRRALQSLGLPYDPALADFSCRTDAAAQHFVERLLEQHDPPTAFFSAQHVTSRGLIRAAKHLGQPIEAAMFDEVVDTDLLSLQPRVVVASGPHRLGHIGATLAVDRLTAEPGDIRPPRSVVLPVLRIPEHETYRPHTLAESLAELASATSSGADR